MTGYPELTTRAERDGRWSVTDEKGVVVETGFASQAEAYRWIDRREGDPTSPAEKRSDFSSSNVRAGL